MAETKGDGGRQLTEEEKAAVRREKHRVYMNAYYHANRERLRAYEKARITPELRRKYRETYAASHPDYQKTYNAEHRDQINATRRARYARNPTRLLEQTAAWRKANPEKARKMAREQIARRRAKTGNRLDFDVLYERDKGICYLCGEFVPRKGAHFDHVVPISKGGAHVEANVRTTHSACNWRKNRFLVENLNWAIPSARDVAIAAACALSAAA